MRTQAIHDYAKAHWQGYIKSVSNLSNKFNTNTPLVSSDAKMYSFDDISLNLYAPDIKPKSVDALNIREKAIDLIEFKSGFYSKISKENFSPIKAACPSINKPCIKYWDLFNDNKNMEKNELISSIKLKGIESCITMEKHILPNCTANIDLAINLIIVIDADPTDNAEDILSELSGNPNSDTTKNIFTKIKSSLYRLKRQNSADNKMYFYDQIHVFSVNEFLQYLEDNKISNSL